MKVLSLSDKVIPFIYSNQVCSRFPDIDLVIGCGDLPYYYLEYVLTKLSVPLYFVRGNHDHVVEYGGQGQRTHPHGGVGLHRRVKYFQDFIFAGIEGSLRYRPGPFQFTQAEMWGHVWYLAPQLMFNRLRYGRYLDVFITHAPPQGIHDQQDLPHQGINAFRWLIEVFKPAYCIHGHIHIYNPETQTQTQYVDTQVINTYGFQEMELESTIVRPRKNDRTETMRKTG